MITYGICLHECNTLSVTKGTWACDSSSIIHCLKARHMIHYLMLLVFLNIQQVTLDYCSIDLSVDVVLLSCLFLFCLLSPSSHGTMSDRIYPEMSGYIHCLIPF